MRMIPNRPQSCHNVVDYEYHRHLVDGGLLPLLPVRRNMRKKTRWRNMKKKKTMTTMAIIIMMTKKMMTNITTRRRIMMSMTMAHTWTIVTTADMSKPRRPDRTIMIVAVVVSIRINNNGLGGSNDVVITIIITTMQEEINHKTSGVTCLFRLHHQHQQIIITNISLVLTYCEKIVVGLGVVVHYIHHHHRHLDHNSRIIIVIVQHHRPTITTTRGGERTPFPHHVQATLHLLLPCRHDCTNHHIHPNQIIHHHHYQWRRTTRM